MVTFCLILFCTCLHIYPFLLFFPKTFTYCLPVSANLPPILISSLLLLIQPWDFIFNKTLLLLNIMMTVNSLFLPKAALFHLSALQATFIKTSNPALCRQKEFVYRLKMYINDALSLIFFQPIMARLIFPINNHSFSALSILTILLSKCLMKRFEDMNILIKAILKFCTTNQL